MNEPLEGAPSKGSWEDIPSRIGARRKTWGQGLLDTAQYTRGIRYYFYPPLPFLSNRFSLSLASTDR